MEVTEHNTTIDGLFSQYNDKRNKADFKERKHFI